MRDITGYEGMYAVTSCGKVWSYKHNRFLTLTTHRLGYKVVNLKKDGKQKQHYVHRLVAEAYLDNPNSLPEVNHKNEDKSKNCIGNLEWCTREYNLNYGTRSDRQSEKMSNEIICIELNRTFRNAREAIEELGIGGNIWCCLKGRQKTAGGYHWRYAS